MKLYDFQIKGLRDTAGFDKCAFYWEMGTGKTFVGSKRLLDYNNKVNLLVCQASKVDDWLDHFKTNFPEVRTFDLTKKKEFDDFFNTDLRKVGIINYDKLSRRPRLLELKDFAVCYDESSMIKNCKAARTKIALKLKSKNVVLLSGTPIGGKYEDLYSQCLLLGWRVSRGYFFDRFIITRDVWLKGAVWPIKSIVGYKNIDELKNILHNLGVTFLRTDEVIELPEQIHNVVEVPNTKEYKEFMCKYIVDVDGKTFVGDNPLNRLLYARMLAGGYNKNKKQYLSELLESTNDRVVIFYNFQVELNEILSVIGDSRPVSIVNGSVRDLSNFEKHDNAVVICQSKAGAKGLNLQKANKLIVYSPTDVGEDHMQLLKRIHRIGQKKTCSYYYLCTKDSVEEFIYDALKRKEDYTLALFESQCNAGKSIRNQDKKVPRTKRSVRN